MGFTNIFKEIISYYIDENLPPHEQAFVCAHELGHMFLHKKANAIFMDTRTHFNTHRYELEANKFAMDFLSETILFLNIRSVP